MIDPASIARGLTSGQRNILLNGDTFMEEIGDLSGLFLIGVLEWCDNGHNWRPTKPLGLAVRAHLRKETDDD